MVFEFVVKDGVVAAADPETKEVITLIDSAFVQWALDYRVLKPLKSDPEPAPDSEKELQTVGAADVGDVKSVLDKL